MSTEPLTLRPEVAAFAQLMEAKLRENDHKIGWLNDIPRDLFRRMNEEAGELFTVIDAAGQMDVAPLMNKEGKVAVGREAADVGNFAMMLADRCGALLATKRAILATRTAPPVDPPRRIAVTKRTHDWHACVDGRPERWASGRSPDEAIGGLVRVHNDLVGMPLTWSGAPPVDQGTGGEAPDPLAEAWAVAIDVGLKYADRSADATLACHEIARGIDGLIKRFPITASNAATSPTVTPPAPGLSDDCRPGEGLCGRTGCRRCASAPPGLIPPHARPAETTPGVAPRTPLVSDAAEEFITGPPRPCPSSGCHITLKQHLEAGHTPDNHAHLAEALRLQREASGAPPVGAGEALLRETLEAARGALYSVCVVAGSPEPPGGNPDLLSACAIACSHFWCIARKGLKASYVAAVPAAPTGADAPKGEG